MTQEQKDLLIKDLCGRLPYGVKVQAYNYEEDIETIETLYEINSDGYTSTIECDTLKNIHKPYLFPLSSMTEEQYNEYTNMGYSVTERGRSMANYHQIDWFHKNHIDYRGLISMGLAIDATGLGIY